MIQLFNVGHSTVVELLVQPRWVEVSVGAMALATIHPESLSCQESLPLVPPFKSNGYNWVKHRKTQSLYLTPKQGTAELFARGSRFARHYLPVLSEREYR